MDGEKSLLNKINSVYNLKIIFEFINYKYFEYILFIHSKYFQTKIGLELEKYKEIYINKLGINFEDFLSFKSIGYIEDFNKNILNIKLQEKLSEHNLEIKNIQSYIINYDFNKI